MTFNLRAAIIPDGKNSWKYRRELAIEVIRNSAPDVMGTQETVGEQQVYVAKGLPEWSWVGEACFGGTFGEFQAIWYRRDRIALRRHGTFWLSDAPEKKGSNSWKSMAPRQCTWARLSCRNCGTEFAVFNTHFDHRNPEARKRSAALVGERIRAMQKKGIPCVLLGDLNMAPDHPDLTTLFGPAAADRPAAPLIDTWPAARERTGAPGTGNWFTDYVGTRRIDHIAVPYGTIVDRVVTDNTKKDDRYPSDHFPVRADLVLRSDPWRLRAADGHLRDPQGRAVVLRGASFTSGLKRVPPEIPYAEPDIDRWATMGFSVVRFLITWEGIMPREGEIDTAYIEQAAERIRWFTRRDIGVIVDMHQDLFSSKFGGDGAPAWACVDEPFTPRKPWQANYLEPAVRHSFTRFWRETALQDRFIEAWKAVVARLRNEPGIVGYEILNEPFPGDIPALNFERAALAPFYTRVAEAIRGLDPDRPIFVEPSVLTSTGAVPSLLPRLPFENYVYAPHYYAPGSEGLGAWPEPGAARAVVERLAKTAREVHHAPLFLGEFGADGSSAEGRAYLSEIIEACDAVNGSWACWVWSRGGDKAIEDEKGEVKDWASVLIRRPGR